MQDKRLSNGILHVARALNLNFDSAEDSFLLLQRIAANSGVVLDGDAQGARLSSHVEVGETQVPAAALVLS